jgi:hypothetical protein
MPNEYAAIAGFVVALADVLADFLERDRPGASPAQDDCGKGAEFLVFPRTHPMVDASLTPGMYMSSSLDHLRAMAAVIEAPGVVMALLTVLRTQLIGSAWAHYTAEPGITSEERLRRWVNIHLDSLTEQMRFHGADAPEFSRINAERKEFEKGARKLHWTTSASSPESRWPKDWCVTPMPPKESSIIARVVPRSQQDRLGKMLYSYLCATVHVKPHGYVGFLQSDSAVDLGDGRLGNVGLGMPLGRIAMLTATGMLAITAAMQNLCPYYGLPLDEWQTRTQPLFTEFRRAFPVL